jgi:hypothetical protein
MTKMIATVLCLFIFCSSVSARQQSYTGLAARYRKGLMERVATNRGIPHERCMIAATYEKIGTWVTVTGLSSKVSRSCLVVDVPAQHDRKHIESRGIVIELSYEGALAICLSVRQRPQDCPVRVTK